MDFLLKKIIKDVRQWYALHFDGLDIKERTSQHCRIIEYIYQKERFINCKNLNLEREKFLNEAQEIMDFEVIKQHASQ